VSQHHIGVKEMFVGSADSRVGQSDESFIPAECSVGGLLIDAAALGTLEDFELVRHGDAHHQGYRRLLCHGINNAVMQSIIKLNNRPSRDFKLPKIILREVFGTITLATLRNAPNRCSVIFIA
jgi:hypothetical protein